MTATGTATGARRAIGIAVLMLGAAPAAVCAQTATTTTAATNDISLNVEARYDSNVARSSRERAALRGLERSDYLVRPNIAVQIRRPIGSNSVYLEGDIGYVFHARNSELDREQIGLAAGGDAGVGPCRLRPRAELRRGRSDLADIILIGVDPIEDVRNTETVQRYSLDATCGRGLGIQPFAGVAYESGRNSAAVRERAEYDRWEYMGGIEYSSPAIGEIRLFVGMDEVDLIGQPLIDGRDNGYRTMRYGGSFNRMVGTRLELSAEASYSDLEPRDPTVDGFNGLNWRLSAQLLLGTQFQLEAGFGKDVSNNLSSDAAYVVTQPIDVRLRYAANERLQVEAGIAFTKRRYEYGDPVPLNAILRENRRIYDIAATYRLRDRLQFRVGAGREERNADGTIFDYNNNFATVGVSFDI